MKQQGVVKWFSTEKGYGFIEREGEEDVFVHRSEIEISGANALEAGQRVEFALESTPRGPRASHVVEIGSEGERARRAEPSEPAAASRGPEEMASEPTGDEPTAVPRAGDDEGEVLRTLDEQLQRKLSPRFLRRS